MAFCAVAAVLYFGHHQQTCDGNAAGGAGAVLVVEEGDCARRRSLFARAIFAGGRRRRWLDSLRTSIPFAGNWCGLVSELDATVRHRRLESLVLSLQDRLATSADFHLPTLEDRNDKILRPRAAVSGRRRSVRLVANPEPLFTTSFLRSCLFRHFPFSGPRIFQRLFL